MMQSAQSQSIVEEEYEEDQSQIFQKLAIYDNYVESQASQQVMKQFYLNYQISRIITTKDFLKVQLVNRRKKKKKKLDKQKQQDSNENSETPDEKFTQMKKKLQQSIDILSKNFESYDYNKKVGLKDSEAFLKTKSGQQNFWIVQFSIYKQLLGYKRFVFSRKMVEMMGYQMQEVALYLRRYKQIAFNHLSNTAYKQLIICLIQVQTQLSELDKEDLKNTQKMQQIFEKNAVTVKNQMIGKDNVKITTMVKCKFMSPFLGYYSIEDIISKEQQKISQKQTYRQMIQQTFHKRIYHSIASIYKLPKTIHSGNKPIICSYRQITQKRRTKKYIESDDSEFSNPF